MTLRQSLRELRHSPCLMTPLSALLLLLISLFSFLILLCQVPSFLLGLILACLTSRGNLLVEFLYPSGLAKWGHLLILKWGAQKNAVKLPSPKGKKCSGGNGGGKAGPPTVLHSRAIEQRSEVVKDRVYVHPLPQLLDNIAYLILCLPPPSVLSAGYQKRKDGTRNTASNSVAAAQKVPIWAIVVDCGDGASVLHQVEMIRQVHYSQFSKNPLKFHAVLSTHKHHDHTAGNRFFRDLFGKVAGGVGGGEGEGGGAKKKKKKRRRKKRDRHDTEEDDEDDEVDDIDNWSGMMGIIGGAIEKVPYGTIETANGDKITLPGGCAKQPIHQLESWEERSSTTKGKYPGYGNDMAKLIEIECVAVPSHTRGSIVYVLRNFPSTSIRSVSPIRKGGGAAASRSLSPPSTRCHQAEDMVAHVFSGDAMFSGGAGVPFESDLEFPSDKKTDDKTVYSRFKPSAGTLSIERCFTEILIRSLPLPDQTPPPSIPHHRTSSPPLGSLSSETASSFCHPPTAPLSTQNIKNRSLLYPGHEYTLDLLTRQIDNTRLESIQQWEKHDPASFFEIVSHFFVMNHRRGLPKCTRLLTVPTSLAREMKINPHMRCLKRRGEHVLRALTIWYRYGNRRSDIPSHRGNGGKHTAADWGNLMEYATVPAYPSPSSPDSSDLPRTLSSSTFTGSTTSTDTSWTSTHHEVNRNVFTTVYSRDLDEVIGGLRSGKIRPQRAAKKLGEMVDKMEEPTLLKRPIPGTLPSEKNMFLGTVALAVLGSAPSGTCTSDANTMRLVEPVKNSDYLLISKRRLVEALRRLDLLACSTVEGGGGGGGARGPRANKELLEMMDLLWKEAKRDIASVEEEKEKRGRKTKVKRRTDPDVDLEWQIQHDHDLIELGSLKQTLYSVPYNQPSWFSKFCMPCSSPTTVPHTDPRTKKKLKRSRGELVRHDTMKCPMCWNAIGCPIHFLSESSDNEDEKFESVLRSRLSIEHNGTDVELEMVKRTTPRPARKKR